MPFEKRFDATVCKVDESLGLVLGWAIICKQDGEPYIDVQNDTIPEEAMLKAAADFMETARVSKEMHSGDQKGTVVFAWPMTEEIAKAMGVTSKNTGLMIGVKFPDDIRAKFRDKSLTGFSIGGERIQDEDVP